MIKYIFSKQHMVTYVTGVWAGILISVISMFIVSGYILSGRVDNYVDVLKNSLIPHTLSGRKEILVRCDLIKCKEIISVREVNDNLKVVRLTPDRIKSGFDREVLDPESGNNLASELDNNNNNNNNKYLYIYKVVTNDTDTIIKDPNITNRDIYYIVDNDMYVDDILECTLFLNMWYVIIFTILYFVTLCYRYIKLKK